MLSNIKTPNIYTDVNINTQRSGLLSNTQRVLFITQDDAEEVTMPTDVYDTASADELFGDTSQAGRMVKAAIKTYRTVDIQAMPTTNMAEIPDFFRNEVTLFTTEDLNSLQGMNFVNGSIKPTDNSNFSPDKFIGFTNKQETFDPFAKENKNLKSITCSQSDPRRDQLFFFLQNKTDVPILVWISTKYPVPLEISPILNISAGEDEDEAVANSSNPQKPTVLVRRDKAGFEYYLFCLLPIRPRPNAMVSHEPLEAK